MYDLNYEERKRLRRLAEDAIDAFNPRHAPFVEAVSKPLIILALLDMADRISTGSRQPGEPDIPLVPTVARLYHQNGYQRASTRPGPGVALARLADAEAAVVAWRTRAEMRWISFNLAARERDAFAAAMRRALGELSQVDEHHECLPAEAASALTNAIKALQRALN